MPRTRIQKDWRVNDLTASDLISTKGITWENGDLSGDTTLTFEDELTVTGDATFQGDLTVNGTVLFRTGSLPTTEYDSVASMVADTTLTAGLIVDTADYYTDYTSSELPARGGNRYLIVAGGTGTDDGGSFIDLDNGLQAKGLFPRGVNAMQFGIKYAAEAGDRAKLQSAIDYVYRSAGSNYGGTVVIPAGVSIQIDDADLVIRPNVTLAGEYSQTYTIDTAVDDWLNIGALVCDNTSFTVDLYTGSCLRDTVVMRRSGIDYAGNPSGLPSTEVANFNGNGSVVRASGAYIKNVTYLGFARAIDCTPNEINLVVEDVNIDSTNGFRTSSTSSSGLVMNNVKILPFLSENTGDPLDRQRSGIGIQLRTMTNTKIIHCSTIQETGIRIEDSTDILIDSCWCTGGTDGTQSGLAGNTIQITGTSDRVTIKDTLMENHLSGVNNSANVGTVTVAANCSTLNLSEVGGGGRGFVFNNADLIIDGGIYGPHLNNLGRCIQTGSDVNLRIAGGTLFNAFNLTMNLANARTVVISDTTRFTLRPTDGGSLSAVASATTTVLADCTNVYSITGTTTVNAITGEDYVPYGRIVVFYFADGCTVNHNDSAGGIRLNGGSNQAFTAGSSLSLLYLEGNNWYEVQRSVL